MLGGFLNAHRKDIANLARAAGTLPAPAAADGAQGAESSDGAPRGATRTRVEVVAWRAWYMLGNGILRSVSYDTQWEGPVLRADEIPMGRNSNGIYAVRTLDQVPFAHAWGEVALSGIVVEGELGYRAEVATIRSLFVGRERHEVAPDGYHPPGTWADWPGEALVKALEERYAVHVEVCEPRGVTAEHAIQAAIMRAAAQQQQLYVPQVTVNGTIVPYVPSGGTQISGVFGVSGNLYAIGSNSWHT